MSTLPFAPLTRDELLARTREARERCGFRCQNIAEEGDGFQDYDLAYLAEQGALANAYGDAAEARL